MAIRVRKLARQLRKPPVELLGILKSIGIDRYTSPEDMLSGRVEKKLRAAVKDGVRPQPVEPTAVRKKPVQVETASMDGLIPGVEPVEDPRYDTIEDELQKQQASQTSRAAPAAARPAPQARTAPEPARRQPPPSAPAPRSTAQPAPPAAPAPAPPSQRDDALLDAEQRVLAAERKALQAEQAALEAERRVLAADRLKLQTDRQAFEAEVAAFEARRTELAAPSDSDSSDAADSDGASFLEILRQRGLVGIDEAERALKALAETRRTAELLPHLRVDDPEPVRRWLADVLVLVDGPPPEALSSEALVTVAPERSEIPGAARWRKLSSALSEKLLLNGARRVLVVGGPIRGHRLLRQGLDPRIEMRFRPGRRVVQPDAEADVTRTDAIALWSVDEDDAAREIYDTGRALVLRTEVEGVAELVEAWVRALS